MLVLLMLLGSLSFAAVAEYSFAQAPSTYTELTAPTQIHGSDVDDAMSPVIDIGFNFAYSDGVYTQFKANSNGFITLNPSSSTGLSNNLTTQLLIIGGVWDDLKTNTDGSVSYELSGAAPNRVLTVQYKNLKWYYSASPVNLVNFQIKLYETTNQVEIVYGTLGDAPGTSASASIGISGEIAGDFLSVTPGAPATASFITEFNTVNASSVPFMTGNKYVFTPPVANQSPNPALVIFPANNGWVFFDSVLSWRSGGGLPDSYNVYFGTDPNPPFIQNQPTTTYAPILAMGTTYYWKIVPQNSFGPAVDCPVWSFRTPTMSQIAESFDAATFPPAGWANPGTYTRSTTTPYHGTATAYKYAPVTPALLSTPLVSITANSALNFWARTSATTGNGRIQIQYSPDRITWTNIGEEIALPTATTWNNYNVDLSSLAGNNYYLAFASSSTTSSTAIYLDLVFGPEIVPVVPDAVNLTSPADAAQNVLENLTLNWTPGATGGVPTGYRVYLDNNPDPVTLATTTNSLQYSPDGPLEYGATYYWKVVAYNEAGDAPASAVRSFTVRPNPVVSTFPYNVDFGTLSTDWPVPSWTQLSGLYPTPTGTTTQWLQDDWLNVSTPANKAAKINIYGSSRYGWLVTPPIQIPSEGYEITFDVALLDWNGTVPPVAGEQADDKFMVIMSDTPNMTNPVVLREWNNTGSQFSYDGIPHTGANTTIPLPGVTGMKYFAFYGESTVSGGDNDLMIDNLVIRQSPTSPIFTITPDTWNYGTVLLGYAPSRQFVFSNSGIGTLNVSNISISGSPFFTLANLPTLPVSLTIGQTSSFNVVYSPTAAGTHTATISITDNLGRVVNTVVVNGTGFDATITTLPAMENWDAVTVPALPLGWTALVQSTVTTAYAKTVTTSPHTTPNVAALYNASDAEATVILIAPPLSTEIPANSTRVKAWLKSSSAGYPISIGVMTNPSDATTYQEIQNISLTTTWTEYTIPMQSYTGAGRYLAVKHGLGGTYRTLYVDEVVLEAVGANDLAATTLTGPTSPSNGNAATYTATVLNNGLDTQTTYTVQLIDANDAVLGTANGISVTAGQTVDIPISWTPAAEGPATLRARVVLAGDINPGNNTSAPLSVLVMPSQTLSVTIGEGNLAEGVPWEFFYKNSLFQTLYYPAEIGLYGQIIAVQFYNNFVTTTLQNKPVKLWLGSTQMENLADGWVPFNELTLVYDGTLNFPAGANTIMVPLQTPYNYTTGNLVLYAQRPMDTAYFSSSDNFQAQTIGSNRARKLQSDSTVLDPAAPTAGTVSGTFPKTTFVMTPLGNDPVIGINPSAVDYGTVLLGSSHVRNVSIMNMGAGTLGINSVSISGSPFYTMTTQPTVPANLTTGQSLVLSVTYAPTEAGTHTATITIEDNQGTRRTINLGARNQATNRTEHTVAITGIALDATITALPYTYSFDDVTAPALPIQWSKLVQATAAALVQTYTTTPQSAPNTAGMTNSSDASATAILIAPPLATTLPVNTTRLKFWGRSASNGYTISVGVMSNPADATTYTEIQMLSLTSTWTEYVVSLTGYTGTGRFISFKHGLGGTSRTLYIDTVTIEQVAPNDLGAQSISGNATPTQGMSANYIVNVQNWGTSAQNDYQVKIFSADGTELSSVTGPAINAGQIIPVTVPWVPATQGALTIYGKVVMTGDANSANDQSPSINLLINPPGVMSLTIGEGGSTARVPLDMFYKNSLFETVFTNAELGGFMGQITGIQFYNNFSSNLPGKPTKVWLGTTTQENLSADWIPSTQLTQVFDGTIDYPTGENIITIPLAQPFFYMDGQNLVMMVNRPMDTSYFSSSDVFVTQTVGSNRSRNIYSDSVTYDPAAPPTATANGVFPKTTFLVIPGGVGDIMGTVTNAGGTPLADVTVSLQGAGYTTTTNASGQYSLLNVLPDNYTMEFSRHGYITYTQAIVLEEDDELVVNATMQQMPTVNVTGIITASDTGAPINGAAITLNGYESYSASTNATGSFTITGVYAGHTYSYMIAANGYAMLDGSIEVGTTNHNMGTMVLSEMAFSPTNVTAEINTTNSAVTLNWVAPDPDNINLVEGFESTVYPPVDWTQTITNAGPPNASGVAPSWSRFGVVTIAEQPVNPTEGNFQTGLWWAYEHQDEWLISPSFTVPVNTIMSFDTYAYMGSNAGDHYYVKISVDNGNTWNVLWDASAQTGGWNYYASPITIDLSTYVSQTVKIAFHAVDPPSNDGLWYVWFIDNLTITNNVDRISFNGSDLIRHSAGTARGSFTNSLPTLPSRPQQNGSMRSESAWPMPIQNTDPSRVLVGYKVWRLASGQENNPNNWVLLNPDTITETTLTDNGWDTLANGDYRWAVKSVYTAEVMSSPAFSPILNKETITGMISGVVRKQDNTPIPGATITVGTNVATTNSTGAYTLILPIGTYSVTASATGYSNSTVENVTVNEGQATTVNFVLTPGSSGEDNNLPVVATSLSGNYPNPFNPSTTIRYSVKDPAPVRIEIYNLKGQLVKTLVNEHQNTGHYNVIWNGRDSSGRSVGSGVYLYRMQAGDYSSTRKMMLME